jgi:hypothetical protein
MYHTRCTHRPYKRVSEGENRECRRRYEHTGESRVMLLLHSEQRRTAADGAEPEERVAVDRQSTLAPDIFTTFAHFAISFLICTANASGVMPPAVEPSAASYSITSGVRSAFTISPYSWLTIARGVPVGATTPCHDVAS